MTAHMSDSSDLVLRLRPAVPDDSEAIAALHVASWCETYRGLMPDSTIDSLSVPDRTIQWQRALERRAEVRVIVAEASQEDGNGRLYGFVSGGPTRDSALGTGHEVYALYVLREAQGQGVGRALVQTLAAELAVRTMTPLEISLGLWVLRENAQARGFYERIGGRLGAERVERREGHDLAEVAYLWDDLARLLNDGEPPIIGRDPP